MSLREISIWFIQCDSCGEHAPIGLDETLANDNASEQGWDVNPSQDLCQTCVENRDRVRTCTKPPRGWKCSRPAWHDGPCAARRDLKGGSS